MPDAHSGYGMPIGGVMATDGVIVPNAVGVDIGCGMCAVKTDLKFTPTIRKKFESILEDIKRRVPVGFSHHKKAQDESLMPQNHDIDNLPIIRKEYASALKQLERLEGATTLLRFKRKRTIVFGS